MSQRVYKICDHAAWKAACEVGIFAGSADDIRDGFIHLSTAAQVAGTLEKHFADREGLVLIAFDPESLGPALKWEASRAGALFPHLYAPLETSAALCVRPIASGDGGRRGIAPESA